ncbi:hypothetical protein GCM10007989_22870 [Devosia pacifica]|uniref:Uncharacterized protein n=1 Tax=Devosia pacifica TaxID=1335967 RepID=A0A918S7R3_9HYPH|nr:hypothetical protein [Devosia pacifica]GHA26500.1 hypothetical protein GCM10007989_22870 [Devosia pacifica]
MEISFQATPVMPGWVTTPEQRPAQEQDPAPQPAATPTDATRSGYAVAWPVGYTPSASQVSGVEAIAARYTGQDAPDTVERMWDEIRRSGLYPRNEDSPEPPPILMKVDRYA